MDYRQRTLRDNVSCTGIGLHSGKKVKITIKPALPDSGIKFIRKDVSPNCVINANFENVVDTQLCTTVGNNGHKVSTIEHLMAAFFGVGIDNARVEVEGPEIPIMDGSAAPFIFLLKSVGIKEQNKPKKFILIKKTFKIQVGNQSITISPSKELKISYAIGYRHPLLENQKYDLCFSGKDFIKEISRARTFGFLRDIQTLHKAGLALGGSLDNAIVIDDFRILNEDGLRFKDEFVRHKILDFIGDMSIAGSPIIGHFKVNKSGHSLNQTLLQKLMMSKKYWEELIFKPPVKGISDKIKFPVFGPLDQVPA